TCRPGDRAVARPCLGDVAMSTSRFDDWRRRDFSTCLALGGRQGCSAYGLSIVAAEPPPEGKQFVAALAKVRHHPEQRFAHGRSKAVYSAAFSREAWLGAGWTPDLGSVGPAPRFSNMLTD